MKHQLASILSLLSYGPFGIHKRDAKLSNPKTPPVTVVGNAFFANGKRFYIRGVDYQPGGSSNLVDPIANTASCKRDVEKFKSLGINTVRIYTVDNAANHDECMKVLADAGIYLALDVNSPAYSLNRENEWSLHASYNDVYLQNVFATIDIFQKYDNTLLFYSANEVIDENPHTTLGAPYVKAVIRDMRNYMKSRNHRAIPVGYSAVDNVGNRYETATYLNCGDDESRSDFFAFNDYTWCSSDIATSGWDKKVEQYKDYGIPFFMSEFGCIKNLPRKFNEIEALYSSKMTPVYSGGLVYEYTQEPNGYGLVEVQGNDVKELPDFAVLKAAFAKTPAPSDDGGYKKEHKSSDCPKQTSNWQVRNSSIPTMPFEAQKYFQQGAGAGVGIKTGDKGSQWAGKPSGGWATGQGAGSASKGNDNNNGTKGKSAGSKSFPASTFLGMSITVAVIGTW